MKNLIVSYEDLLNDKTFRTTADKLVMRAGISAKFKGATTLSDAVILYGTDVSRSTCTIYRLVGEYRGIAAKTVMREISYAIYQSPNLAPQLSAMIGIPLRNEDLHSGLVISYLGMIFKNPDLSLYGC